MRMLFRLGLATVAALATLAPSAAPAAAYDYTPFASTWTISTTTYKAVPDKGWVDVSITLKITNETADTYESYPCIEYSYDPYWGLTPYSSTCTRTKQWYISETSLYTELGADAVKATSPSGKVKLHRELTGITDTVAHYTLTFPRAFYGQTRTIKVTYRLNGRAAMNGLGRVNGAYVSIGGFAQPTDSASVRMVVPSAFSTGASASDGTMRESTSGGWRTYDSGPVANTSSFYVVVAGTNLAGYHRESIQSPDGREIRLESWPGDDAWLGAVRSEAASSIGALETVIGQPLPGSGPITVREVAGGSLGDAYAGVFDPKESIAQIPESYGQPGTVAHELSHTWFNRSMFEPQWLSEGYAQWAERAVGANQTPCQLPRSYGGVPDGIKLSDWKYASPRATQAELKAVSDEYDAACGIVTQVATEIGPERMRDVLAVVSTAQGAYPGTRDTQLGAPNDWRAWLDAVDELGMAPAGHNSISDTAELLVAYGAATEGDLAGRADAREALAELRDTAGKWWTIPAAVYGPFGTWDFTTATKAVHEMDQTIRGSWEVPNILPQLRGVDTPLKARVAAATTLADLAASHETVDRQVAAAHDVADALDVVHGARSPIEALGLVGVDFGPIEGQAIAHIGRLDLDAAGADVAIIEGTLQGATTAGWIRLGAALGALALAVVGTWLLLRRRRRRGPGGAPSPLVVVVTEAPGDVPLLVGPSAELGLLPAPEAAMLPGTLSRAESESGSASPSDVRDVA
jgi:hypothetical protein